jgi:hypothetical protein
MKLTENFYLEEFTQSDTALRLGIKNIPSPHVMGNLKVLADGMEKVRALLGHPITISSGFKCWKFGTPDEIVRKLKASDIKTDQVICEGTWVHISFAPAMRNQYLRALFDNKGKATYREFV